MDSQREMMGFMLLFVCFWGSSQALTFHVGGKEGWALKPSEGYSHWSHRNRFQVNDTLFFKYKKGSDSVLIVEKNDYYNCNKAKPIQTLADGDSYYKLNRSGPFFFISGEAENCNKGQKLEVVVLALRHHNATHKAPSPTPAAASSPSPTTHPVAPSPPPAANPVAPPPKFPDTPKAESPISEMSPDHSPVAHAPAPAPSSAAGIGGGSVGLVMGVVLVLGLVYGLV